MSDVPDEIRDLANLLRQAADEIERLRTLALSETQLMAIRNAQAICRDLSKDFDRGDGSGELLAAIATKLELEFPQIGVTA